MTDHANVLVNQARAFLKRGDAKSALGLLKEARVLSRDDKTLSAHIRYYQLVGQVSIGNDRSAVSLAQQIMRLDASLAPKIRDLAGECRKDGNSDLAEKLEAYAPKEASLLQSMPPWRGRLRSGGVVLAALAIVILAIVAVRKNSEASGINIDRYRENVGLVLVLAEWVRLDGTPLEAPLASGSCFAISEDGYILTNKHVTNARHTLKDQLEWNNATLAVQASWRIVVCFGPDSADHYDATIVHESPYHDVALLKVQRSFASPFRLCDSVSAGEDVYALGFLAKANELVDYLVFSEKVAKGAYRFNRSEWTDAHFDVSITKGIVSAVRNIEGVQWIQHDALFAPGSTGGPLVTSAGRVVGINTAGHAKSEGFNAAIAMSEVINDVSPYVPEF